MPDLTLHATHAATDAQTAQRQRLQRTLRLYGGILLLGLAYLAFCLTTGLRLPCPFYSLTGLLCPGCGVTRLMIALARLDFPAAYAANPLLFVTGPFILGLLVRDEYLWIKTGTRPPAPQKIYIALLICFTVFTVWRNLG